MKLGIVLFTLALGLAFSASVDARTWYIKPDGTGDAPTIQAGIDVAANGDSVLLANGTYTGDGNRDIDYHGKAITVQSESGSPELCIVDCQGAGRGFYFHSNEGAGSVLEGVTIRNGYSGYGGGICYSGSSPTVTSCTFSGNSAVEGGGMYCSGSSPIVTNCTFSGNSAGSGGGMHCDSSSPGVTNCTFSGNSAFLEGGGMYCQSSSPTVTRCTFSGNGGGLGSGIWSCLGSSPTLEKTIIAFSTPGQAVYCGSAGAAALACCDVYGNAGGDWAGCIADQYGVNGNISADPLFCDAANGNFCLDYLSPCASGNHPGPCNGERMGAWGVGCDHPTHAVSTTWGAIKVMYR